VIDHDWLQESLAELERLADRGASSEAVTLLATMTNDPQRTGTEAVLEDTLH
jgi:hypothetical protein